MQESSNFKMILVSEGKENLMDNTGTVREIYEAFGRGDVPAILSKLDDNVEWETQVPVPDVPWLQSRRGKANIAAFFEALTPLKITRFEPHTFFENGDKVCVLIAFEATNQGKSYSFPNEGHLWQFNSAGKVTRYDHITDTAQMIRMAKGE
jgi:ketosteroid isomerase-like protein